MKKYNILVLGILCFGVNLYATPNFAREYQADCSTCHTMIPLLNDTGKSFLRNGFRFSSEETPSLKKMISPKEGEKRHIPLAIMLNANYDSQKEDFQEKVKLYGGGTVSKNLSFFALTKDTFNENNKNNSNDRDFFEQSTSRAYLQLNFKDDKHVIRAGLMSPLTQFGNIIKASADSGLKGHNSNTQTDKNNGQNHQKYGNGNNRGQNGNNAQGQGKRYGADKFMTPLQQSAIGNIKGVEYSYLANNKLMLLASYGENIEKGNGNSQENRGNGNYTHINLDDSDDYQFVSGVKYNMDNGLKIGLIYNKYKKNGISNESSLLPIEKDFDKFSLIATLVYKGETNLEDKYYGIENSIIYSINDKSYLRGIIDMDTQDDNNNYGLSLSYSQMYKYFLFHLTGARKITEDDNENLFLGSVSFLF